MMVANHQIFVPLAVSIFNYDFFKNLNNDFFLEFCPADCNWDTETSCPGFLDPKTGEQSTSDTCIVAKIGDCENHCPMNCGENEILCPGKIDPYTGCKMPDTCQPGSKLFTDK